MFDSYCILTSASPLYQQCWMCDETIFRILNSHYPQLKKTFNFTRRGLNRVLSAKAGSCTVQNPHAIYAAQFKTDCPYFGDRRKVFYYFRQDTNTNEPPDDPMSVFDIVDKFSSSNQLQRNCIRLGSNMPNVCLELGGGEDRERGGGMDSNSTRTPAKNKLAPNVYFCPQSTPASAKERLLGRSSRETPLKR